MKIVLFILCLFISFSTAFCEPDTQNDPQAYIIYSQGNEQYKVKNYDGAKNCYLQLINQYPKSKFVPYSIYMLSFMETDYIKIIDYLSLIKDKYTDFRYWTNAVEKLGEIFYVMGNHKAAIEQYKIIATDKAYYMLSLIYSANGFQDQSLENINKLLLQTKDNSLAYKGFLLEIKIYLDGGKFNEVYPILQQALKLKRWAYDNGTRVLFYSGKYYFYRKDIINHYEKTLYIFTLLKTNFPLSVEATMADSYLEFLKKNNIVSTKNVLWIADTFSTPEEIPYQSQTITPTEEAEKKAENISSQAEEIAGNMVRTDIVEYVVRIGEYKDLSVANLTAKEIVKNGDAFPLGIYYRNDTYFAEIHGIKKLEEAKNYARKLIDLGYRIYQSR